MIVKNLLCPERTRRIPSKFSWVDHRLVREHYIERCGVEALALYLLLVTVGDAEGMSYYSDSTVAKLLSLSTLVLKVVRNELVEAGLIAYKKPLYQVLSLDRQISVQQGAPKRQNDCASIGEILRRVAGGVE